MPSSIPASVATLDQICRENLAVYRESPARLQEDVSQESQVAHDYRGRLVYELLQNADDALLGAPTSADRVLFRLTAQELWVANTGRALTESDVRGLCGLGASSKVHAEGPKRASIGHKGLGFKSVLEITDAPEAYSDTVCFRLGMVEATDRVQALWSQLDRGRVRAVPAMRFPSQISAGNSVWEEFQKAGFHIAFRFPFDAKVTPEQRHTLATQLLTLPMTSVLFLKHLEEVVIEVDTSEQRGEREWLLERRRVTPSGFEQCPGLMDSGLFRVDLINGDGDGDRYWVAHNADVVIGEHREGLAGPAWEGVDVSEVSVAVRDSEDPTLATEDQRFHVFLPTQEPSGCSVLVNGAFTTDLSRQHVQVPESDTSYNGYLIQKAAETFVQDLLPHLLLRGEARYVLRVLDRQEGQPGGAADVLHRHLCVALAERPLLPAGDTTLSLSQSVLPTPLLGSQGREFADQLRPDSRVEGRSFPDPEYCEASLGRVSAAYGAKSLTATETLTALAELVDPARATLRAEPEGRFSVDPVLDLCAALWEAADAPERRALEAEASKHPVFPIGENQDGTVNRIALGEQIAFYPPQSSAENLPLRRLRFLAHAVCWGSLGRTEQRSVLDTQMKAWGALFDIKEFRFEEVMRAAVLPGLTRAGSTDEELRDANRSIEALATICRLAGKTTKPDQPLSLGRLGSDRAFFNLSRLEVPCRNQPDGEQVWAPAHRVYFGRDWVGLDSVEDLADAMAAAGAPMDIKFLAPSREFEAFASAVGVADAQRTDLEAPTTVDDGEVDLEDDTDEILETTAADRWRNFFAWLGVSRGLRLVHFHDVDDAGTGWTSTKGMQLPGGWAFGGLDQTWAEYRKELTQSLEPDPRWNSTDHYLYQVRTLDRFNEISQQARIADNRVAETLLNHLVRNWNMYGKHVQAQVALVGAGKWPSSRTAPPRATSEELVTVGPDFWLFRLRNHAFCPTSHGPRRPDQTWRRSTELERRLGRGGRQAESYIPVLQQPAEMPASLLRACLDELQVRGELTPAAFTLDDAKNLCERISEAFSGGVSELGLRSELRPLYRQLFELLVGKSPDGLLSQAPLAARTAAGIQFLPARDVVYASTSGSRERSGVQGKVPLFVLEAEPGALAPLRNLFGTPLLETSLDWSVKPGEPALEGEDLTHFRSGLRELLPLLLARLSADRAERAAQDRSRLRDFVEKVEPVESLTLGCSFRGEDLGEVPQRTFFVRRTQDGEFQGFVVWSGPSWPPIAEDAQTLAMALAETLEVNTVETFLSFINAPPHQRVQLLDLAGASERLAEVESELAEPAGLELARDLGEGETQAAARPGLTDGEPSESENEAEHRRPPLFEKAPPRVPLHRFEDLLMDGEVIRVGGTAPQESGNRQGVGGSASAAPASGSGPRAAAGTDLTELDRLGMRITIAFERRRLDGMTVAVLPGDASPVSAEALIVDVSSPGMIHAASQQSSTVQAVLERLMDQGISPVYPGFDILTIKGEDVDRMIELKSSGVDAQVQAMSWNEWKTAQSPLGNRFWLYLVGNLRADLHNSAPFLRAVRDPFGTLAAAETEDVIRKRTVQLRVREFPAADQLTLGVRGGLGD